MGFRFKRILRLLPGVWLNVSKSALSATLGTRGATVNVGKDGITTTAGIPGSGMSWRQKLGTKGTWIGIALLIAGAAYAGYNYLGKSEPAPAAQTSVAAIAVAPVQAAAPAAPRTASKREPLQPGVRYVRRNNSVLRVAAKPSAKALARKAKGAAVTVLAVSEDGWAEVRDGELHGYMRASVLGEPPELP